MRYAFFLLCFLLGLVSYPNELAHTDISLLEKKSIIFQVVSEELEEPQQKEPTVEELVKKYAKKHNVDYRLVLAMIHVESTGNPKARSSKGAYGLLQLMPSTAKSLGVNPKTIDGNIEGGTIYIKQQLIRYKDVRLALAAYNAGPGAVDKYGSVPPFEETENYVERICGKYFCGHS